MEQPPGASRATRGESRVSRIWFARLGLSARIDLPGPRAPAGNGLTPGSHPSGGPTSRPGRGPGKCSLPPLGLPARVDLPGPRPLRGRVRRSTYPELNSTVGGGPRAGRDLPGPRSPRVGPGWSSPGAKTSPGGWSPGEIVRHPGTNPSGWGVTRGTKKIIRVGAE